MKGQIIVVLGPPGAGKSTLAQKIIAAIPGAVVFSNDQIRYELGFPVSGREYTKIVYKMALESAIECFMKGGTAILDSTYYSMDYRQNLFSSTLGLAENFCVVELAPEVNTCRDRILERALQGKSKVGGIDDERKFDQLMSKTDRFSVNELPEKAQYLKIDTTNGYQIVSKSEGFSDRLITIIKGKFK